MKKSENNLSVLENFILHVTHCSGSEDVNFKSTISLTPELLYQMALDYIEEDHVDGKDNLEDHIVTFGAESSFDHEDKDKEYPENIVVVADFGEEFGTQTIATIDDGGNLEAVKNLLEFVKSPYSKIEQRDIVEYKVGGDISSELIKLYVKSEVTGGEFYHQVLISLGYEENQVRGGIQDFLDWNESEAKFKLKKGHSSWIITDV